MTLLRLLAVLSLSAAVAMPVTAQNALAQTVLTQDRRVPTSQAELQLSYAPIVQHVQPAVVNVFATKMVPVSYTHLTLPTN